MNFWRVAVLTVATAMLSASPASACSCLAPGPPCEMFWKSDAVFVGQVTAVQRWQQPDMGGMPVRNRFSFDVQKVYRGEVGVRVEVVTGAGGGDCGYRFQPGVTYLVYAYKAKGALYTGSCGRTKPLDRAQEDIAWLEMSGTLAPGANIFGKVSQDVLTDVYRPDPLAGVSISLRDSAGREHKTVTDASGGYSFRGLDGGRYFITPERPATVFFSAGEPVRQPVYAEVHDRGCAEVNFHAVTNGRILGYILAEDGAPVPNVTVGVQRADDPNPWYAAVLKTTSTSPDGSYQISGLPAGTYIVMVNPSGPDKETPYPRRFYPSAGDMSQAIPVQIGEGEEASNIDVRLPQKLTSVSVEVLVIDSAGRPARGAYAAAHSPITLPRLLLGTAAESDGISRLELFAEGVYSISAKGPAEPGGTPLCGGPVSVHVDNTKRLALKLERPGPDCVNNPR